MPPGLSPKEQEKWKRAALERARQVDNDGHIRPLSNTTESKTSSKKTSGIAAEIEKLRQSVNCSPDEFQKMMSELDLTPDDLFASPETKPPLPETPIQSKPKPQQQGVERVSLTKGK